MTQETVLHIIGTDLLDYSFKVEQAIKEGYTFSDSNQYAPRAWPHMFEAWMLLSPKGEEGKVKSLVESKDASKGVSTKDENKTLVEDSNAATKQVNRRGVKK